MRRKNALPYLQYEIFVFDNDSGKIFRFVDFTRLDTERLLTYFKTQQLRFKPLYRVKYTSKRAKQ